ncbi:MAG: hypothetical protein PHW76_07405 [Alphaproteobacteria bacterium]|nr:hypothetical protein [Alphaproteobacteria bacterium]
MILKSGSFDPRFSDQQIGNFWRCLFVALACMTAPSLAYANLFVEDISVSEEGQSETQFPEKEATVSSAERYEEKRTAINDMVSKLIQEKPALFSTSKSPKLLSPTDVQIYEISSSPLPATGPILPSETLSPPQFPSQNSLSAFKTVALAVGNEEVDPKINEANIGALSSTTTVSELADLKPAAGKAEQSVPPSSPEEQRDDKRAENLSTSETQKDGAIVSDKPAQEEAQKEKLAENAPQKPDAEEPGEKKSDAANLEGAEETPPRQPDNEDAVAAATTRVWIQQMQTLERENQALRERLQIKGTDRLNDIKVDVVSNIHEEVLRQRIEELERKVDKLGMRRDEELPQKSGSNLLDKEKSSKPKGKNLKAR